MGSAMIVQMAMQTAATRYRLRPWNALASEPARPGGADGVALEPALTSGVAPPAQEQLHDGEGQDDRRPG